MFKSNIKNKKHQVWRKGENLSCKWLKKHGYKIIQRNFSAYTGEIDIIAKQKQYLCFIEVKSRISSSFQYSYESLHLQKISRIKKTASIWLLKNKLSDAPCRFDVILIIFNENYKLRMLKIIKDAF